ncbi:winged helix-turn-helix domain-containing protein [Streptomyces melanogenes]|uniref:Winged helix-turn-helix domain-containing protein n=1 Tax=Streptomyces melanogenes TaxID=67326 RepID=A0ABZ1XL57_9ACTN|nr:winged helix-turn-helix domain-containing protein [Streptomyces melanogenes]
MTVAADDPRPKKVQIADVLREEITAAQLPAGHRLATLREMAKRFKVTTVTVGQALQILLSEGLIESVPTRGYFVKTPEGEAEAVTQGNGPVERDEIMTIHSEIRQLAARVAELEKRADRKGSA